jgi:hypothetical protein
MRESFETRMAKSLEATFARWGGSVRFRSPRKRALVDGIFRTCIAMSILVGGLLLPVSYINHDPIMRNDPDLRVGPGLLFSLLAGAVYGALAFRTLYRASAAGGGHS